MGQIEKLDEQLRQILETAGQKSPVPDLLQYKPVQAFAWPWQVPQVPSYTTDHAPSLAGE